MMKLWAIVVCLCIIASGVPLVCSIVIPDSMSSLSDEEIDWMEEVVMDRVRRAQDSSIERESEKETKTEKEIETKTEKETESESAQVKGWDLPLLPSFMYSGSTSSSSSSCTAFDSPADIPLLTHDHNDKVLNKYIPRQLWFAIRNRTHSKPGHHSALQARNPLWNFNYCDNQAKDEYMVCTSLSLSLFLSLSLSLSLSMCVIYSYVCKYIY